MNEYKKKRLTIEEVSHPTVKVFYVYQTNNFVGVL